MEDSKPLILVDGYCNLCNNTVRFIRRRDRNQCFQFAALQSEKGIKTIKKYQIEKEIDSVILIYKNHAFIKSDVIIEASRFLPIPWRFFSVGKIIPQKWRDIFYDFVAKNRYKWFGKKQFCEYYPPVE